METAWQDSARRKLETPILSLAHRLSAAEKAQSPIQSARVV